jgi:hypothetical protein
MTPPTTTILKLSLIVNKIFRLKIGAHEENFFHQLISDISPPEHYLGGTG